MEITWEAVLMSRLRISETEGIGFLFYTCPTLRFWTARRAKNRKSENARKLAFLAVSVSGGMS